MAAENEASRYGFMEPSDTNLPPLSASENLPDDVIVISPLTQALASPLPAQQTQLWIDTECEVNTDEPFSVSDTIRGTGSLFGSELISTAGMQKVATHNCSKCGEVFKTRYALNKHLQTHRPERSHVRKEFTCHDLLTGHMVTHKKKKKKKDYRCSYFGCHKMYCGYRSLQRHCATQHGTSLLPPYTQPCPLLLEPPKHPAAKDGASALDHYNSSFLPTKPRSTFHFNLYAGCRTDYTLAGSPNFHCKPEDGLSHAKYQEVPQSWSLTADGASCSFDPAIGLSASHGTVKSNQRASPPSLVGSLGVPLEPKAVHNWGLNLEFLTPTRQLNNEGSGTRIRNQSSYTRTSQPDFLKRSSRPHGPPNNQQVPLACGVASCAKLNPVGSSANHTEPFVPLLHPGPKTKKKKILKPVNIPTPPLPSPKPTSSRRPRARTSDLVSPSQVAMASFSKMTPPTDTFKGGSTTAKARKGKESGERIYLKHPPRRHEQFSPRCHVPTTCCKIDQKEIDPFFLSKVGEVGMAGFCYEEDREVQLSPLVIPVSVPVSNKESETTINVKKSSHPGVLQTLITAIQAAGGYPSHLRSPTYLANRLLSFNPPPYTPPPMLSPLRPGTGLYFNTLPQYQPTLPPPNIYSALLDGEDELSLIADNTVTNIKPKINVGSRFQAEIPPLRNPLLILYDEHPAELTWAPWGDLPTNPKTQQKVTEFLAMCCSSVLPGGGTNTDLALHCLHEAQGDVLAALDLLLVRGDYRTSCHPLSDYHYTGSDHWSAREMRLFQETLLTQTKDFHLIHRVVQTKSVAQCVEYYYAMKKVKKFKQHWRAIGTPIEKPRLFYESRGVPDEQYNGQSGATKSLSTPKGMLLCHSTNNWEYTCEVCGREFHDTDCLRSHMKGYRHQERNTF